jgi:hypothetical protein
MKRVMILFVMIALMPAAIFAQDSKTRTQPKTQSKIRTQTKQVALPDAVSAAFEKRYPDAALVSANTEQADGAERYRLKAKNASKLIDILYSPTGEVVKISEPIEAIDLPDAVKQSIRESHSGAKITSVMKHQSSAPSEYEVVLSHNDDTETLVYDASGILLRTVAALPKAVEAAFRELYPKAELTHHEKHDDGNHETFTLTAEQKGTWIEAEFAADGHLIESSESASAVDLPESVKLQMATENPNAKIKSAKKTTRVDYEVTSSDNGDSAVLTMNAAGQILGKPFVTAEPLVNDVSVASLQSFPTALQSPPLETMLATMDMTKPKPIESFRDDDNRYRGRRVIVVNHYIGGGWNNWGWRSPRAVFFRPRTIRICR